MKSLKILGLAGLAATLAACGAHHQNVRSDGGVFGARANGGLFNPNTRSVASARGRSRSLDGEVMGVNLQNKDFDIPVVYNEEVQQWLEYFTGVGRRHFNVYLERKAKFEPVILPRLKAAGVPQDLIYLAMIESGFSTAAYSHAGAAGPWQFIASTGRLYGLQSDYWTDERRDPEKSTDAAVAYLSRLYAEFGDWQLACAAYNSGEQKIRNAIARLGTRDFFEIAKNRKALRRETKDYVPKMMAAAIIGKNPEQFGFLKHSATNELLQYAEVRLPHAENIRNIARVAGVSKDRIMDLNPSLSRCCTPPKAGSFTIRVPKGDSAQQVMAAVDAGELGRYAGFQRHVVRRGDTLARIAKRSGVPATAIIAMNDLRSATGLKPGTELVLPEAGGRAYASSSRGGRSLASASRRGHHGIVRASARAERAVTHVVKRGETLTQISRRYDVRVDEIRRWNQLSRSKKIRPGSRIKLYVRNDNSETI